MGVLYRSFLLQSLPFYRTLCGCLNGCIKQWKKKKGRMKMLFHKCRCGALIPQNVEMCDRCNATQCTGESRHMQYNKYRRDRKRAAFYVSTEWRTKRVDVLRNFDGLDIYALYVQKRIETADMVHHIVPLEEDWNRRTDESNLIPLSNQSHGIIEALYKKDERTKKETQKLLIGLVKRYQEDQGGVEESL